MPSNEYMKEYVKNRRLERRAILLEMAGNECVVCGSTDRLEFDHIDRKKKKFNLSGKGLDKPWYEILEEFEKCQLLCRKHHRQKTIREGETGGGHNKILNPTHGSAHNWNSGCRCEECRLWKKLYRIGEVDARGLPA